MRERKFVSMRNLILILIIIGVTSWIGIADSDIKVKADTLTEPIPINQVFPDASLAEVIRANLGKGSVTDTVSQSELDSITTFTAEGKGINAIEGVQYLNNVTSLSLSSNAISDISPLSGLVNIDNLQLGSNQIEDISPVSGLSNLRLLTLENNMITNIAPISGLNRLSLIDMSSNNISDISSLANLPNPTGLRIFLNSNNISDISPLSGLTELTILELNSNNISDVSGLSNLTNLKRLYLSSNSIKDISPLSSMGNITVLQLSNQQIQNEAINFQGNIVIPNEIKDTTGTLVAPSSISDGGSYVAPNVTWDLASYLSEVSYEFSQSVSLGSATTTYSGTVRQPLNEIPATYDAIFIVDGAEQGRQELTAGSLLEEPTALTKEGYTFTGWYDTETGGNKWDFATDTMPAGNLTLYAQFSVNSYEATFDVDGTTTTQTVVYGELLEEPAAPTKEGYTFTGWYDAKTGGNEWDFGADTMPAENITLYAQFSVNSYVATFDVDATTTTQTVAYGDLLEEPAAPTKEGYTFTGWYDAETGGNEWDFATDTMPAGNLTLYAQFSVNSYVATFDVDGITTTQTVAYGELLEEPTAPTKEGYVFKGWYDAETGGNKWDFTADTMPAENLTLYAQFSIEGFEATFDVDGTTTTQTVAYGDLLEEPEPPTKEGYTFEGWYDAETGGNKWDFATDTMPAENLTLYAQFSVNSIPDGNDDTPNQGPDDKSTDSGNEITPDSESPLQIESTSSSNKILPRTGNEENGLDLFAGMILLGASLLLLHKKRV
ncbi:InlB B-repeat-containing protein [Listeria seeligeri]|uniref:InlB B-repeat-containing protein n=1 Tax=Listeria seeligeri TaxID=1640 RepID=UPI0015E68AB5|nr:InlB B-repeat-containing protein [Listeria seeligeri]